MKDSEVKKFVDEQLKKDGMIIKDVASSLSIDVPQAYKMLCTNLPTYLKYIPKRIKTPGQKGGEQNIIVLLMNCRGIGFDTLVKHIGKNSQGKPLYPMLLSQKVYTADKDTWVYLTKHEATKISDYFDMDIDVLFNHYECRHEIRGSKRRIRE